MGLMRLVQTVFFFHEDYISFLSILPLAKCLSHKGFAFVLIPMKGFFSLHLPNGK